MLNSELERLEGVWTGNEHVHDEESYAASGRLVFQSLFDGRFLLCEYMQTALERPTAFAHGVFRQDARTNALTVTWFRSQAATQCEQTDAIAEGGELIFFETIDGRTTRTGYRVVMDRLSVYTDLATRGDEWKRIFDATYRRR